MSSTFFNSDARVLQGRKLTPTTAAAAFKNKKYIFVFFGASWCPPCGQFTPKLREFYYAHGDTHKIEVLFVPLDEASEADMRAYMESSHGNWLSIPFEDAKAISAEWMAMHKYITIPSLLLLERNDAEGVFYPIVKSARDMVVRDPGAREFPWRGADAKMNSYYNRLQLGIAIVLTGCAIASLYALR